MSIKDHKDLLVWQKSMKIVSQIYTISKILPSKENFILKSQILRSAISVPSNIAEGFGRNRKQEFIHFLTISAGSAAELETQCLIIKNEYPAVEISRILEELLEVEKMLGSLIRKLESH